MEIKILDENFFYSDMAEGITESILMLNQQSIKSFENYSEWLYDVSISEDDAKFINWTMNVVRSSELSVSYDIIGSAGRDETDEPSIDITIVLPEKVHQNKIKIKYDELFEVVAHELHHLAQNIDNNSFSRETGEKGRLNYLLDPFEIEAFHIGIRAQSALTGRSFDKIAREYITKSSAGAGISLEDIERVINTWENTSFPAFMQNKKRLNQTKKLCTI